MKKHILFASLALIGFISCKKDTKTEPIQEPSPVLPSYVIPTTYTFQTVNYSGQTTRLSMLDEMINYMKTGRVPNTLVSATTLKNMFSNTASPFANAALNTSGKQLENKFFSLDVNLVKSYMDSIASASTNSLNIVVSSTDPTRKYLLNANGFDYTEMIEKLTMGAVFYYQAMEAYICSVGVGSSVDNTTIVTGEGTAMEHHWDEGFGYMGVPIDYPTNTTGIIFWGEYIEDVGGGVLGNKTTIMNAFLKGRAAISNKDYTTRDEQINVIQTEFERLVVACAIHELNEAKVNLSDDAIRNHVLSEAKGFIMSLKYKTNKAITLTQINNAINTLGTNHNSITLTAINQVIDDLANIYSMQSIKASL
ncbi:MAG: DUF4856 domain-containing protein [Burkholderiales bacterium]|nr:DUF4856 domain-containing protein [Bacteroidia bacterium]